MRPSAVALLLVRSGLLAGGAGAQNPNPPGDGPKATRVVTIGPEYAAGPRKRLVLGTGYRDLWTTPVRLEVLDLKKEGGGLNDSVEIGIALADRAGAPYYRRRFLPSETGEVRVFLHGGDDHVERSGRAGGPITVRLRCCARRRSSPPMASPGLGEDATRAYFGFGYLF